jgi:LPS-assembly protein
VELRWPWARVDGAGGADVIEPVVQLVWSRPAPANHVPNEDSTLVEFDEGNLFGFSRFAGADRREGGTRINAGLQWTRTTPDGWHVAGSVGRVIRLSGPAQFTAASGLAGRRSDWLAALHMAGPQGTVFQGRAVFDDRLTLARGEFRLGLDRARYGLAAGWLYAQADPLENRPTDTAEWVVDGRVKLSDGWTARGSARYDFDARRTTAAALGLEFANECLRMDLTLSRRFTTSATVAPTTDFGVSIDFLGFGGARPAGPGKQSCR